MQDRKFDSSSERLEIVYHTSQLVNKWSLSYRMILQCKTHPWAWWKIGSVLILTGKLYIDCTQILYNLKDRFLPYKKFTYESYCTYTFKCISYCAYMSFIFGRVNWLCWSSFELILIMCLSIYNKKATI